MNCEEKQESSNAAKFAEVLKNERDTIAAQRAPAEDANGDMPLAGLAFSGGGIRSAVFNLGFIQGLANRNSLHVFDYLSTVSGGGYIGGWLSALLKRKSAHTPAGEKEMRDLQGILLSPLREAAPANGVAAQSAKATGFPESEGKPVRFLRRYSNYLTPRLGLSGDTLALISLGVRNFAVMQMLLVSMLVAVFAGLSLVMQIGNDVGNSAWCLGGITAIAGVLLVFSLCGALSLQKKWQEPAPGGKTPKRSVAALVLAPALFSGVFAAIALENATRTAPVGWGGWGASVMAILYALVWYAGTKPDTRRAWVGIIGGATMLGALLHSLLSLVTLYNALAFAPPVAMALFSLVITVHLALAGSAISEQNREWWARLGGQGMALALAWSLAFVFLLYVPPLISFGWDRATYWLIAGGGLSTTLTVMGAFFAKGNHTGGKKSNPLKEIPAKAAPWIFLVLMLGLIASLFVHSVMEVPFADGKPSAAAQPCQASLTCEEAGEPCCLTLAQPHDITLGDAVGAYQNSLKEVLKAKEFKVAFIFFTAGALFLLLLIFVDLNLFSAHSFYASRLARTFMGASQKERKPNPYTGFDPEDDLPLSDLAGQRPIHLVNATLNLTGGEDLAWQTRRGACFTFTPCYSGYSARDSSGAEFGGYRRTTEYGGGLTLATTVATSGAAASPNMGFHTSASVAALLTAFNLRLARWCPNPEKDQWKRNSPKSSAAPLFAELLGSTNGENTWVNLSDGGHFENLGIYELIRRRAALILVTDVGADGKYQFDDLAMAVRKIWVDFGVRVEIAEADLDEIRPKAAKGAPRFSEKHWAIGRICYPEGIPPGYLIYVKSTIAADAPVDIRQYYDAHPAFPHEPTADQWFDEDQFEAYRHLGQIIAEKLFDKLPVKSGAGLSASEIIGKLYLAASDYFCLNTKPTATQGGQP